jgi:LAO/AO transport system kinase
MAQAQAPDPLLAAVEAGEARAVARLITRLESGDARGRQMLQSLHRRLGRAHVVGVTGAPGTGKSTIVDRLIEAYRRAGLRVAVVAVDPTSPFTGGAILGDRIRMQRHAADKGVFIRSMGTRGALGGLAVHTADAVQALDGAGFDVILVETVGVGQAEVDVARLADTVIVVLVPNLGDDVQAVKAGIMEIADLFAINKCDIDGGDKVAASVEANLALAPASPNGSWTPPILRLVSEQGTGIPALVEGIATHRAWSEKSGELARRRALRVRENVRALLQADVTGFAFARDGSIRPAFAPLLLAASKGERSPQDLVDEILRAYRDS